MIIDEISTGNYLKGLVFINNFDGSIISLIYLYYYLTKTYWIYCLLFDTIIIFNFEEKQSCTETKLSQMKVLFIICILCSR